MPPKKGSKIEFEPRSMVLSKMTGFPAWPSFVMPPDMIPPAIMKAKKKTTNTCVIFIPDGDFNWMNEKSLEHLTPAKLDTYLSKVPKDKLKTKAKKKTGRTNNVAEAYIAAKGLEFDAFMEELAAQNKGVDNDEDEEEGSDGEEEVDENNEGNNDQEDEREEAGEEDESQILDSDTKASTRSRRRGGLRSTRNGNGNAQSALETDAIEDEKESEEDTESIRSRKRTRGNSSKGPNKRIVSNSSVTDETNGSGVGNTRDGRSASPKPLSEKDRQHQLWLCRIKLQRSLIQRNQPVTPKDPKQFPPPTVDELLVARLILHRLADFPMSVELLRETKIHKVLKCILKDEDLAYNDSFKLHEKCNELLEKWNEYIESLKLEKQAKLESRLSSQAPEEPDEAASGKEKLRGANAEKVEV